jgi:hypothetical protein
MVDFSQPEKFTHDEYKGGKDGGKGGLGSGDFAVMMGDR